MSMNVQAEVSYMSLSPDQQQNYEVIRSQVGAILAQDNGLELLLNALTAQGNETTLVEVELWLEGVKDIDPRTLVAYCHGPERLVTVESTIVDL